MRISTFPDNEPIHVRATKNVSIWTNNSESAIDEESGHT